MPVFKIWCGFGSGSGVAGAVGQRGGQSAANFATDRRV